MQAEYYYLHHEKPVIVFPELYPMETQLTAVLSSMRNTINEGTIGAVIADLGSGLPPANAFWWAVSLRYSELYGEPTTLPFIGLPGRNGPDKDEDLAVLRINLDLQLEQTGLLERLDPSKSVAYVSDFGHTLVSAANATAILCEKRFHPVLVFMSLHPQAEQNIKTGKIPEGLPSIPIFRGTVQTDNQPWYHREDISGIRTRVGGYQTARKLVIPQIVDSESARVAAKQSFFIGETVYRNVFSQAL